MPSSASQLLAASRRRLRRADFAGDAVDRLAAQLEPPVPDPTWGQAVHAVIIPAAPAPGQAGAASADEIISWCRDNLAHFKCPKSVEFTTALPRTTTGKVLKRELREQLAAAGEKITKR